MELVVMACLTYCPVALALAAYLAVRRLVRGHW